MGETRTSPVGYRPTTRHLRVLAAGLAYLVAALHLFHPEHGFPRLALLVVDAGVELLATDPRPLAFVLSAVILMLGVSLGMTGYPRERLYLGGILLVGAYFLGYFAWHFTGHGGFLPGRQPTPHEISPIESAILHLQVDPWALVSKLAEAVLLVVLGVLYRRES